MGAGANKIEIMIPWVPVSGAHVPQLHQCMGEAVSRTFDQVVSFAPGKGREVDLKLDVIF